MRRFLIAVLLPIAVLPVLLPATSVRAQDPGEQSGAPRFWLASASTVTPLDELGFLVGAGLSPLEALQAATLHPAEYLDATDSLGTVEPGKLADLVLLDADPLADIHNLRRIQAVVANGRYFDRAALDALLAQAQRAAATQ